MLVSVDIETLKILKYSPRPHTHTGRMNGDGRKEWSTIVEASEVSSA